MTYYKFSSPTETTVVSVSGEKYVKVTVETHRDHSGVNMETGDLPFVESDLNRIAKLPLWMARFSQITKEEFDAARADALVSFVSAKVGVAV